VHRLLEPWCDRRRIPAGQRRVDIELDVDAVRRIGLQALLDRCGRGGGMNISFSQ
jgi:hypothetical protein